MISRRTSVVLVSAATLVATSGLLMAGPLNPPAGPVTSTMKTLTEVEPRIAINASNTPGDTNSLFKITQPGSYYLAGNIAGVAGKQGIEIAASGVTLDLNGFIVTGSTGAVSGISTDGLSRTNISVVNGTVTGWQGNGVDLGNTQQAVIRGVRALSNGSGTVGHGIRASDYSVIEDCFASGNAGFGFDLFSSCSVVRCEASLNGNNGIDCANGCLIVNCNATGNQGIGIRSDTYCRVTDCVARGNAGDGISVTNGSLVSGCAASQSSSGIVAASRCRIVNNNCSANTGGTGGSGIRLIGADNTVESNTCSANTVGIQALLAGNIIIKNTCSGNTTNWSFVAGNAYGPIVAPPVGAAVNGNTAADASGSTHPNANFSY